MIAALVGPRQRAGRSDQQRALPVPGSPRLSASGRSAAASSPPPRYHLKAAAIPDLRAAARDERATSIPTCRPPERLDPPRLGNHPCALASIRTAPCSVLSGCARGPAQLNIELSQCAKDRRPTGAGEAAGGVCAATRGYVQRWPDVTTKRPGFMRPIGTVETIDSRCRSARAGCVKAGAREERFATAARAEVICAEKPDPTAGKLDNLVLPRPCTSTRARAANDPARVIPAHQRLRDACTRNIWRTRNSAVHSSRVL